MPGPLVRPKDIVAKLHTLDERTICEMYARLLPRAMEMNPLREWSMKMNPTRDDLADVLMTLPPKDMQDAEEIWDI